MRWKRLFWIFLFAFSTSQAMAEPPWEASLRLEGEQKYQEALDVIRPLLASQGSSEIVLLRHGWLNYMLGNLSESAVFYEKALALEKHSIDAPLGLTLPLLAQERWREAGYHAAKVLEGDPKQYTANLRMLESLEGRKKWGRLLAQANRMSNLYPKDATPLVYMARAHAWRGEKSQARSAYDMVVRLIPKHIEANNYLRNN